MIGNALLLGNLDQRRTQALFGGAVGTRRLCRIEESAMIGLGTAVVRDQILTLSGQILPLSTRAATKLWRVNRTNQGNWGRWTGIGCLNMCFGSLNPFAFHV